MANLYEINATLEELYENMIDPETGEIDDELFAQFDALKMDRDVKIENLALWIKNLNSDAEAYKAEAKAFQERAKSAESKANNIHRYLESSLNGEKFETSKCKISWRSAESVECTLEDYTSLPEEYLRFRVPELNKTEIKKAIKDGKTVEGCHLVKKLSMSIK